MTRFSNRVVASVLSLGLVISAAPVKAADVSGNSSDSTTVYFYDGASGYNTLYKLDNVPVGNAGSAKIETKSDSMPVTSMLTDTGAVAPISDNTQYTYVLSVTDASQNSINYYAIPDPTASDISAENDRGAFKDWFGIYSGTYQNPLNISALNNKFYPRYVGSLYNVDLVFTYDDTNRTSAETTSVHLISMSDNGPISFDLPEINTDYCMSLEKDYKYSDYVSISGGKLTISDKAAFLQAVQSDPEWFSASGDDAAAGTIAIRILYTFPEDTKYTVNIYKQSASDTYNASEKNYELAESVTLGTSVPLVDLTSATRDDGTPLIKNYVGFELSDGSEKLIAEEQRINPSSNETIDLYYDREMYSIMVDENGGTLPAGIQDSYHVLYGSDISGLTDAIFATVPNMPHTNNSFQDEFVDWHWSYIANNEMYFGECKNERDDKSTSYNELAATMPAGDITIEAHWADDNEPVQIIYMLENPDDDGYSPVGYETRYYPPGMKIVDRNKTYIDSANYDADNRTQPITSREITDSVKYPVTLSAEHSTADGNDRISIYGSIGELAQIGLFGNNIKVGEEKTLSAVFGDKYGGFNVSVTAVYDGSTVEIKNVNIALAEDESKTLSSSEGHKITDVYSSVSLTDENGIGTENYTAQLAAAFKQDAVSADATEAEKLAADAEETIPLTLRKGIVDDDTYRDSGFFSYYYCDAFEDANGNLLAEPKTVSADGENYVYVFYRRNYYTVSFHPGSYNSSNSANPYVIARATKSTVGYFTNDGGSGAPANNASYWKQVMGSTINRSASNPGPTITYVDDDGNTTKYSTDASYSNEYTVTAKYGANIYKYWPVGEPEEGYGFANTTNASVSCYGRIFYTWATNVDTLFYQGATNKNIVGPYSKLSKDIIVTNSNTSTSNANRIITSTSNITDDQYYQLSRSSRPAVVAESASRTVLVTNGQTNDNTVRDYGYKHDVVGYWPDNNTSKIYFNYYEYLPNSVFESNTDTLYSIDPIVMDSYSDTTSHTQHKLFMNFSMRKNESGAESEEIDGLYKLINYSLLGSGNPYYTAGVEYTLSNPGGSQIRTTAASCQQTAANIPHYVVSYAGFNGPTSNSSGIANDFERDTTREGQIHVFYRPERYTVTYVSGGATEAEKTIIYGEPFSDSVYNYTPAPRKTSYGNEYTFGGWYTRNDYAEDSKIEFTDTETLGVDLTLYAKWIAPTFSVTFTMNGFSFDESKLEAWESAGYTVEVSDNGNTVKVSGIPEGTTADELIEYGDEPLSEDEIFSHWNTVSEDIRYPFSSSQYIYEDKYVYAVGILKNNCSYTVRYLTETDPENGLGSIEVNGITYYRLAEDKTVTGIPSGYRTIETDKRFDGYYIYTPVLTQSLESGKDTEYNFIYDKNESEGMTYYIHYLLAGKVYERDEEPDENAIRLREDKVETTTNVRVTVTAEEFPGYIPEVWRNDMILSEDSTQNHIYFYYYDTNTTANVTVNYFVVSADGSYPTEPDMSVGLETSVGRVLYGKTAAEDAAQFYTTSGTITGFKQNGIDSENIPDADTIGAAVENISANKIYDEENSTKYVVIQDENGSYVVNVYMTNETYTLNFDTNLPDHTVVWNEDDSLKSQSVVSTDHATALTGDDPKVDSDDDKCIFLGWSLSPTATVPDITFKDGQVQLGTGENTSVAASYFTDALTSDVTLYGVWITEQSDIVCYILHEDGTRTYYDKVQKAVDDFMPSDYKIVMIKSTTEDVTIDKIGNNKGTDRDDVYLDFDGYSVTGDFTVPSGKTFYGIDSKTDKFGNDYKTGEDVTDFGTNYGGIIGNVVTADGGTYSRTGYDPSKAEDEDHNYYTYAATDEYDPTGELIGQSYHRVYSNPWTIGLFLNDEGTQAKFGYGTAYYGDPKVKSNFAYSNGLETSELPYTSITTAVLTSGVDFFDGVTTGEGTKTHYKDMVEASGEFFDWNLYLSGPISDWTIITRKNSITPYVSVGGSYQAKGKSNIDMQNITEGYSLYDIIKMFDTRMKLSELTKSTEDAVEGTTGDTNAASGAVASVTNLNGYGNYVTYTNADIEHVEKWLVDVYNANNPSAQVNDYAELVTKVSGN